MLDLLLTNARIVDGTGNPWRKGCVGVRDGRIVAVGSASLKLIIVSCSNLLVLIVRI